jgi:hypothetical protein
LDIELISLLEVPVSSLSQQPIPSSVKMAPFPITFASGLYDRMIPLATGEVRPTGIDLNFLELHHPRDVFDRMVSTQDFDCSELSAS